MNEFTGFDVSLKGGPEDVGMRFRAVVIAEGRPVVLSAPDRIEPGNGGWRANWNSAAPDLPLAVELAAETTAAGDEIVLAGRIVNIGDRPIRVDYFQPLCMAPEWGGALNLGRGEQRLRVFVMTEDAGAWSTRVEELRRCETAEEYVCCDRTIELQSSGVTALQNPDNGVALAAGFLDFSKQFGSLSLAHGFGGVCRLAAELEHLKTLEPDGSAAFAPLWLAAGADPLALLERYAERLRDRMRIRLRADNMPHGWISWYGYRTTLSEQDVRENAAVVRAAMFPLGGRLCLLDLGWNEGDRPGDWLGPNDRYPHGVDTLCRDLAADGFQVSLWSTPLVVSERSHVAREHPEWLLRQEDGRPLRLGTWFWEPMDAFYCLDPSLPAVRAHVTALYRTLRGWGVDYFKLDFSMAFAPGLGHTGSLADRRRPNCYAVPDGTRAEQCRRLYETIREAIGDSHMTVYGAPWQGVIGITDSMFLASDVGNLTDSESQDERPRRRGWDYFRERSRHVFARWFMHGRTWLGNPDCFVAENDASDSHARARLQVVMLAGGQYKCSSRLPGWRPDRLAAFLKGLPAYGRAAVPLDLFDSAYPRLLDLPVETEWDVWHVVGLFNWESCDAGVCLDFKRLRPAVRGPQLVWDFWASRFLGMTDDALTVRLPGESATLVGLRAFMGRPQVLGTDMHFTMGWAEIPACRWDSVTNTLSGTARRCAGARGSLFIHVPPDWTHPRAVPAAGAGAILEVPLVFETAELPWTVSFNEWRK